MPDEPDVTLQWLGAAIDPLYSRLPGEKPCLEATPGDAGRVDCVLLTHGHLDHSADFPSLLERWTPAAYAPEAVLAAARSKGVAADWPRCHALETVEEQPVSLGDAEMTPYRIGTEQIDLWFIRSMLVRPFRHRRPQAVPHGVRWLRHHLFCNCFARLTFAKFCQPVALRDLTAPSA